MNGNFNPYVFNMMLNMMNMMHPTMGFNQMNYNNNNYNNQDLWNMMNNWMNNNPALFQIYNNMNNMNNMNQFNNNNNQFNFNQNNNNMNQFNNTGLSFSNNEQIKVDGGGQNSNNLQGNEINLCQNNNELKTNVIFITQKGKKMIIIAPVSMKMKELLVQYVVRNGLGPKVLEGNIFFIYNGLRIDHNEEKSVGEFIKNLGVIVVLDKQNLIGA